MQHDLPSECNQLLKVNQSGLYCPIGDFYIDPWKPVDNAIITHVHPDHARIGHRNYLVQKDSKELLRHQLGAYLSCQSVEYGEIINRNGVKISLHPAGHIPGSAQVRLEYKDQVWAFTSDFKTLSDGLSADFEPMKSDVLVTEGTFGLPLFKWKSQESVFNEINEWWAQNAAENRISILVCNAIGKAQRILRNLSKHTGPVVVHRSIFNVNKVLNKQGYHLPKTHRLELIQNPNAYDQGIVLIPQNLLNTPWINNLTNYSVATASAWMTLRGERKKHAFDNHFILSDHADWNQLRNTVIETGAKKVMLTHGYSSSFYRWLRDSGIETYELKTEFRGEMDELFLQSTS